MPIGIYNHPLFGVVKFKTQHNDWRRGDPITFIDGFSSSDVVNVTVPQLRRIPHTNGGVIKFHKRGQNQLLAAFEDIERLGLLKHIDSCAGAFHQRLKKPVSGALSKEPSNHSFGIAIDLNSDDKCLGCTTAPLAPVFQHHGFRWGKAFNDPMHYEIVKFIDNDAPSVKDVTMNVNSNPLAADVKSIFGDLFVTVADVGKIPGLKVTDIGPSEVAVDAAHSSETFPTLRFGEVSFAPLPQILGFAGLKSVFDNGTKILDADKLA
jgi:hypothetical protein